jgi:hypothetical protein
MGRNHGGKSYGIREEEYVFLQFPIFLQFPSLHTMITESSGGSTTDISSRQNHGGRIMDDDSCGWNHRG